jgi:tetratricopeptide (TPR) repeat protein
MKERCVSIAGLFVSIIMLVVLSPSSARAERCEQWAAKVVSVQGVVEVQMAGKGQWVPAQLNETYCAGDIIRVLEKSRADIAMVNHPVLRLDQNSTITLGGVKEKRTSVVDLFKGAAHFFSRVTRNLEVRTASVNAGVEGTEFFVRVEDGKTFLSIFEGKVLASNQAGSLAITTGQSAVAEEGKAPSYITVVKPRDAVQWALYYPPIVTEQPEALKDSDPRFYTYRASTLLHVGRVEEAQADISRALEIDPNNSMAFALQSIIAVVQNEKEQALALAEKAVTADPDAASAQIALSYAQQANFNLEGALDSLKKAVKLEPENALAWARLAEMHQSFGRLSESLEAAEKAVALNPELSRTQTVLGFAYLTKVKTGASRTAFEKAIQLDQADPLPRLGLGLAKIREGDVEEGRREIEIAVSLDPDSSIIRSYLGKSYFEEKRPKLDGPQYDMAKELDPKDPTPWFYDAIRKQTVNRPVEALHDMEKAIALNDNRAVYRSQLLLDQDLAARSAGLARIYSDLGFEQLALVEGWKSVNTDPSNYSAHRFLADSYSVHPRHEIARVSELLQSQLLQPLNLTPIQPRLAESNLLLISAGGPAGLSFNEFNPLFHRDRLALQVSGIIGNNGTYGEEVVVSGIYKKISFSVGQTHFETDGWRDNADQDEDMINAFVQFQISPKTSIQAEYRYRDSERGDLALRFFDNPFPSPQSGFLPGFREEDQADSIRLGFHHTFSPGSDLIGNFMYQDLDSDEIAPFDIPPFDPSFGFPFPAQEVLAFSGTQDAVGGELQHLFRSKYVKVTSGVGYFETESEDMVTDDIFDVSVTPPILLFPLFPPGADHADVDIDSDHANIYIYTLITYPENVTFTIGGSVDFFEAESVTRIEGLPDIVEEIDEDQVNPKFGITWNPFSGTTVRGAIFKTMKRLLITDQTLEPTQVAGFNQFYDDLNATEAWRYGIALDQKISKNMYGGVEYSMRELEVPFFIFTAEETTGALDYVDWDEDLARVYLYWTPHKWIALKAEYQYEQFERDLEFNMNLKEVKTHKIPLGVSLHHPCGMSANLQATFYDQEGDFESIDAPLGQFTHGEDTFWLVDAGISYRLPKRHGFITVGARNLFDEEFKYFDTDPDNPAIIPERMYFARVTLSF